MYFEDPAGAKTGKLFPTGLKKETIDVPGYGKAEVTMIDCSNRWCSSRPPTWALRGQN